MLRLKRAEDLLLFLTLLFLPTQFGKHFWPDFAYIYSLKIDYLSPVIYFWDILVVALLIVWILKKPKINKTALNLLFLFLLTQALSLFWAKNMEAGLVRLEQYGLAGLFGIYLASADLKALRNRLFLPLSLGISGEFVIALLQFIKGSTLGLWILGERAFTLSTPGIAKFDFYGREFLRPYATFPHPNVLAGFMLIGLGIMYISSTGKQRFNKIIFLLGGIAVFLTVSRTAILAGLVTSAAFLKKRSIILGGVVTAALSPILFIRYSSLFNFDNLSLLRREELIGNAWQMFLHYPVFGWGLNNFIPAMSASLTIGPSRFLQPVHNIFLLVLSETGLVGLMGLIVLIGWPVVKRVNLLLWLMVIFLGMFDHYFLTLPQGYRMFFLVWGLSFSVLTVDKGSKLHFS